jgi:hypothetical protein
MQESLLRIFWDLRGLCGLRRKREHPVMCAFPEKPFSALPFPCTPTLPPPVLQNFSSVRQERILYTVHMPQFATSLEQVRQGEAVTSFSAPTQRILCFAACATALASPWTVRTQLPFSMSCPKSSQGGAPRRLPLYPVAGTAYRHFRRDPHKVLIPTDSMFLCLW